MIKEPIGYFAKTKPFTHQECTVNASFTRPYYGFLWEMGTGKSKAIIDTFGRLFCSKEIDGVILVGDKGNYRNWVKEVAIHLPDYITRRVAVYSSSGNKADERALDSIMQAKDDCLDILVVNIESFVSEKSVDRLESFIRSHYVLMCIDEATSIKNPKAQRTKQAIKLGQLVDYRRIATGTPITQSPMDVFAMCQFLKSGVLGFANFTAFRAYYAQMIRMNLGPGRPSFDKIVGFRNLDQLTQSLEQFCSRITKEECLDLPDKIYQTVEVELTDIQRRYYDQLKNQALIQLEQGLLTSTSALTTLMKLQQIVCGHVKLDDGTVVDLANNRIDTLLSLIEELGDKKVVIWCNFQRDVELIYRALQKLGRRPVTYYGPNDDNTRTKSLSDFVDGDATDFVGTTSTGGKGITLTVASYEIYYSNGYSLANRLQSEDRCHRIGQKNNVTIIDLVAIKTCDEKILESHKMKKDLANEVLGNMRQLLS
ncbi:ATP dependent DNA helicase [Caudoviricetes sp.]|nr:ATP dependent DNA helicase [Caudoviricetes sp.]